MKRMPGLFLLVCFFNLNVYAQEVSLRIRRFDQFPELNNVSILNILHDKIGFVWLATNAGLYRFDGHNLKVFHHIPGDSTSLGHNGIVSLSEDTEGNIWMALSRGGVSKYSRKTGLFTNFPLPEGINQISTVVDGVFCDPTTGYIYAGVDKKGVLRIDQKNKTFTLKNLVNSQTSPLLGKIELAWTNHFYHSWKDPDDSMFWVTTRDGLYRINPVTGESWPVRSPGFVYDIYQKQNCWEIAADGDLLWMGGWVTGLQCLNRKTFELKQYLYEPSRTDIVNNVINGVAVKNKDEIWVSTFNHGIGVFNKKTATFRFFDNLEDPLYELSKGAVSVLSQDRHGNLWIVCNGTLYEILVENGLFYTQSTENAKLVKLLIQLFEDREQRFFFAVSNAKEGIQITDKRTGKTFKQIIPNPPGTEIYFNFQGLRQGADGVIWLASRHRLYNFNTTTARFEMTAQPKLVGDNIYSNFYNEFDIDPSGRVWLGTSAYGLICFDPKTGQTRHFMPDSTDANAIPTNIIGVVKVDGKGRCWFGSRDQTCYGYYLEKENRFVRLGVDGQVTQKTHSQRTNFITTTRDGNIWVSSESGLLHFDVSGEIPVFVKRYSIADGLSSDFINRITEDYQGNIWGGALRQLFKLDRLTGKIENFGSREGFKSNQVYGYYAAQDSTIYAFSADKVIKFKPDGVLPQKPSLQLALTSFRVDDQETWFGSTPIPDYTLVVPAESRHFSLEFTALDLSDYENQQYEYLFEEYEKKWIKTGTRNVFGFSNIPPGRYTFKVKLAGAPDSEAIAVIIKIEIAFYKTGWFWTLIFIALAYLAWRYIQQRRHQAQQLQALTSKAQLLEKEKAVVMYESLKQQLNPHFLFNSLTSLGSLIQIEPKSAAKFLETLSKTYRYILKSSEHEVVSLQEELKFADGFVKLQQTRFEQGFEVDFDVDEAYLTRKIVPVTLQNLIENAIKHNIIDEESPLRVEIFVAEDYLVVRNNLQKKKFVETSNQKGLAHLQSFYRYLSDQPIVINEGKQFFTVKIPLI